MKTAKTIAYYTILTLVLIVALMFFKASAWNTVRHPDNSFGYTLLGLLIFFFGQDCVTFLEKLKYPAENDPTSKSIALSVAIRFIAFCIAHICATQAEYAGSTFANSLLDVLAYFAFMMGRIIANDVRNRRILAD